MCFGRPAQVVPPPQPQRMAAPVPEPKSPEIDLASEEALDVKKKKASASGTSGLRTDLNIPTGGSYLNV